MNISISTVKYPIPFFNDDFEDIREEFKKQLNEKIILSKNFKEQYGESDLCIIIVHEKKQKVVETKGPSVDDDLVDYTIWLSIKKIKSSENRRFEYALQLKNAIVQILEIYNFSLKSFDTEIEEFISKLK